MSARRDARVSACKTSFSTFARAPSLRETYQRTRRAAGTRVKRALGGASAPFSRVEGLLNYCSRAINDSASFAYSQHPLPGTSKLPSHAELPVRPLAGRAQRTPECHRHRVTFLPFPDKFSSLSSRLATPRHHSRPLSFSLPRDRQARWSRAGRHLVGIPPCGSVAAPKRYLTRRPGSSAISIGS